MARSWPSHFRRSGVSPDLLQITGVALVVLPVVAGVCCVLADWLTSGARR